jgi:hypothetical protein
MPDARMRHAREMLLTTPQLYPEASFTCRSEAHRRSTPNIAEVTFHGPPHRRVRARLRPRQHSQSVLGMFTEPCRSVATQSSRRIVI